MLSSDQKPLEILHDLILINDTRIEGYHHVNREINVPVLNDLFLRLIGTSLDCKRELSGEVYKLGGAPPEMILWETDLRKRLRFLASVVRRDHKTILDHFIKEEASVIGRYEAALNNKDENITTQHHALFHKHYYLIKSDQDKITNLLNIFLKQR